MQAQEKAQSLALPLHIAPVFIPLGTRDRSSISSSTISSSYSSTGTSASSGSSTSSSASTNCPHHLRLCHAKATLKQDYLAQCPYHLKRASASKHMSSHATSYLSVMITCDYCNEMDHNNLSDSSSDVFFFHSSC